METSNRSWRHLFVAALKELDSKKFAVRLSAADDAIFDRLLAMEGVAADDEERLALEETMEDIRLLRNDCHLFGRR